MAIVELEIFLPYSSKAMKGQFFFIKLNPYTSNFVRTISIELHLCLGLPIRLFPPDFSTEMMIEFLILPAQVFDRSHKFDDNLKLGRQGMSSAPCTEGYL